MTDNGVRMPQNYFMNLNYLRGFASLAVLGSHLFGNFIAAYASEPPRPYQFLDFIFRTPLNIADNGGWFGVSLFFLISGFVVTSSAFNETIRSFLTKRALRIYIPLIVVVVVLWLLAQSGAQIWGSAAAGDLNNLVLSATLMNYFTTGATAVLDVSWTLAIEISFYLLVGITIPILTRKPIALIYVLMLVQAPIVFLAHDDDGALHRIAVVFASLPILGIGAVIFFIHSKKVRVLHGLTLIVALWIDFVWSNSSLGTVVGSPNSFYYSSTIYAMAIFVIAVLTEGKWRRARPLDWLASRSYSIYLVHSPVGFSILLLINVELQFPYWGALALAVAGSFLVAEVLYRLAEKPSVRLGRDLFRG
jgi:exopolysaccharide production protein ExoZ